MELIQLQQYYYTSWIIPIFKKAAGAFPFNIFFCTPEPQKRTADAMGLLLLFFLPPLSATLIH